MKIYDEITKEEIHQPDLSLGYLYLSQILVNTIPEHEELMEGTQTTSNPRGLYHLVPEEKIYEPCKFYHLYTKDEIEEAKNKKIAEMSSSCENKICEGAPVSLSDDSVKVFSYKPVDQTNISEMFMAVRMGANGYLYHEDEGNCMMYSAKDIVIIYSTLIQLKTAQTTYFNQLKQYIKTLKTMAEIKNIFYGMPLPQEYQEKYDNLIAQAQEQQQLILEGIQLDVS